MYARVSSEAQEKQQTIASQMAELRAYAAAQRLALAHEFVDDGYSGSMLERPGLDALRDRVAAGEVDTILCLCPDRLSRNFVHLGILLEEFAKHGARVQFLNQQVDDTPEGKLLLQIQGAVAEYERTKIMDRTRRGRQHKARQGIMPGGQAPYGYDYVPGESCRWRVNETEAEVVREVFRLVGQEGHTLNAVARELTARGITPKRGGDRWGHSTVYRILTNQSYLGTAHFFKERPVEPERRRSETAYRRKLKTSQRKRAPEEWIPVPVPAILDQATFDQAQARMLENQRFAKRNNRCNPYLLRGLVRCAACGYALTGQPHEGRLYYECRGQKPDDLRLEDRCRARSVRTDRIEPVVWQTVVGLLSDPELLLRQAEAAVRSPGSALPDPQARKAQEHRLAQLEAEEMRVVRLFRVRKISERVLDAQLAEIAKERTKLRADLEAAATTAKARDDVRSQEQAVRGFCADVRAGLDKATTEEKQEVLRLVVDRIEVDPDGDHGTLFGIVPLPAASTALLPRSQPGA